MLRFSSLLIGAALIALPATPVIAFIPHGVSTSPPPATTCPNGTTNAAYDGCQQANANALFINASLNNYAKDINGNTATLQHTPGVTYNEAGKDFPVGPIAPFVYADPYTQSATGSMSISGTTLTISALTSGYVDNGMTLFTGAGGNITDHPVTSACSSHTTTPITCTLSKNEGTKSGTYHLGFQAPCYWTNGGASASSWSCDFRYPNQQLNAVFDHIEFGATGGHTSSTLRISAQDNGFCTLTMTSNHFLVDAQTDGANFVSTAVGVNCNTVFTDNECDGGNSAVPVGSAPAAFTFKKQTLCFGPTNRGLAGGGGNVASDTFARNYIHDFAGNPITMDLAYSCITSQANVFYNNGGNNGNDVAGGQTGLHGASIQFGTTAVGAENYCVHRYNDVVIYPYGFRAGVTTGAFALLGGAGSAIVEDDTQIFFTTAIYNIGTTAGHSIASNWVDIFRTGKVVSLKIQNNFSNNIGLGTLDNACYNLGGDVQGSVSSPWVNASMTANAGMGTSVWTVSGLASQNPLPYPGQAISTAAPSGTVRFTGTLTDNGNGTSTLNITSTQVGSTTALSASQQITALRMADIMNHPTLIVSGSGSTYIVSNGTGSGETRGSQSFYYGGQVIAPFGTGGTTATGGTNYLNYDGSYQLGGENTVASSNIWNALNAALGNVSTIDTDIANNYDMQTAGSAGLMLPDGINLGSGACPGTSPP